MFSQQESYTFCAKKAKANEICSAETFPQTLTAKMQAKLTLWYGSRKFDLLEKISINAKT